MAKITPNLNIGDNYGSWAIIEARPRTKEKYYLCECKCGTTKEVSKSNLALGKSTSCNKGECKSKAITQGMTNNYLFFKGTHASTVIFFLITSAHSTSLSYSHGLSSCISVAPSL